MPLYYSNFKSFSNKISRIFWFEQLFCMAFISYTERPILALSSIGEARARLIWVDFSFVMSQETPIRWALNSGAAQAYHGHPTLHGSLLFLGISLMIIKQSCIKFKKFRSRSAHHNDLREKIKIKFTGISELDLSFQFTLIWCDLKFMVRSRVVQCPLLKGGKKNAKALSTPSFQ